MQFRGFSILPPRSRSRKGKKHHSHDSSRVVETTTPVKVAEPQVRPHSQPNPLLAQAAGAGTPGVSAPLPPTSMASQSESPKSTIKGQWEMPAEALEELASKRQSHRSHQVCPSCGATDTERRRRKMWEKAAFAFTSIRAYKCRICGSDFYARRKQQNNK